MNHALYALIALLTLQLAACSGVPAASTRRQAADTIAAQHNMQPDVLNAGMFDLKIFAGPQPKGDQAIIYIAADGVGWRKNQSGQFYLVDDPTPNNQTLLSFAANDTRAAVYYLARPCQYVGGLSARNCTKELWGDARYSERVVTAMNRAVDQIKQRSGATNVVFVGHSGGGVIALLLAARRSDVKWVVTFASPLDIDAFTTLNRLSSIDRSHNPTAYGKHLVKIPQIHYFGEEDVNIPASIGESYMNALPDKKCVQLFIVPGADHGDGWENYRQKMLGAPPTCRMETK